MRFPIAMRFPIIVMIALAIPLGVLLAPAASAQRSGGAGDAGSTTVTGNTRIDAAAGNVSTVASGINDTAVTNIGAITGKNNGTQIDVSVQNVDNVVRGSGHSGCVSIASSPGSCR